MSNYEEIKKKKLAKRKIKQALTSLLLVVVFVLWGIYALLQSDFLNLKIIEVNGNDQLTQEEIVQVSKLVMERNLFKYNLEEIKERLISHPYVEEVEIERKLPNRIIISLKERVEYAIISYMGSFLFIDSQAVVLKIEESYLSQELPLITGAEFQSFTLGQRADIPNQEDLMMAIRLIEAARLTDLINNISEINVSEKNNIKLITFDGIEVLMGDAQDPIYSMLALQEVLVNLYTNNRRNVIIDLRYEGHITVRDRTR